MQGRFDLSSRSRWWRALGVFAAGLILLRALPVAAAAPPPGSPPLAQRIDSRSRPLPVVPIVVPQDTTELQARALLTPGNRPTLFQISHAAGPYADPAAVRFFQMVAVEYPLEVNFRKVASGSNAAGVLYPGAVSRPVYVLCRPGQSGGAKCAFVNEAAMPAGRYVTQKTIENFIYSFLGITPTLLTTFRLTPENLKPDFFAYQPVVAKPAATAKWTVVLFFPGGKAVSGPVNRLRVLMALERFFYLNRLRIAECDLSTSAAVWRALVPGSAGTTAPTAPELWLFDPATRHAAQYAPANGERGLLGLTHPAFQAWLAKNGVPLPPNDAIDLAAAWNDLAGLEAETGQ